MTGSEQDTWNTWDADWPASIVHLGSGAVLRIGAYSASANRFTDFPWSAAYRLGTHRVDASEIAVDLTHAGSTVRLELAAPGDGSVTGQLTCADMAEWGAGGGGGGGVGGGGGGGGGGAGRPPPAPGGPARSRVHRAPGGAPGDRRDRCGVQHSRPAGRRPAHART
jgi:hypothetical protein